MNAQDDEVSVMKLFQRIVLVLLAVAALGAGIALIALPFSEQAMGIVVSYFENSFWRMGAGIVLAAFALFALLPFGGMRPPTQIVVPSPNGNIVIHLAPVEVSMTRTLGKLPIIKKAHLRVMPTDENRKVRIAAQVALKKPAGASAVETTERLREYIDKLGRRILGATEVTTVELVVTNLLVDPTQTAESLNVMLKGLEEIPIEAVAASAAAAPVLLSREETHEPAAVSEERPPVELAGEPASKVEAPGELLNYDQYRRATAERVETPEVLEPEESHYRPGDPELRSGEIGFEEIEGSETVSADESEASGGPAVGEDEEEHGPTSSGAGPHV